MLFLINLTTKCKTNSINSLRNNLIQEIYLRNYLQDMFVTITRKIKISSTGFHLSTFVYSCFSTKIQFVYYLLNSLSQQGSLMVDAKVKLFEIQVSSSLENAFPRPCLTVEAQLVHCLSTVAVRFLGILEFYGQFQRGLCSRRFKLRDRYTQFSDLICDCSITCFFISNTFLNLASVLPH